MENRRKFLLPLATLVGLVANDKAVATTLDHDTASQTDINNTQTAVEASKTTVSDGSNLFDFVISRSETGVMLADHYSHRSHSSHSSHTSSRY